MLTFIDFLLEKKILNISDYAYTPNKNKPSTWKLKINDAKHISLAVAALNKGFRGNKVKIPNKDIHKVILKVRKAYKKFYPDRNLPQILK
jgi:hypothetical protein